MRLSVTGIRGKSLLVRWLELILRGRGMKTLAKVTGNTNPHWIHNGQILTIERKNKIPFLNETLDYRRYPHDVLIAENQAISAYTMRVFNDMVRPDAILLTNIRLDHTDTLGETKQEIAESIGSGFTKTRFVVSAEMAPYLNEIIQRHAARVGASFIQASSPPSSNGMPVTMLIGLVESTLIAVDLPGLTPEEINTLSDMARKECSNIRGKGPVFWFDGAEINDPESAGQIFDYLISKHPEHSYSVVAYLRPDRRGRTKTFLPWFEQVSKMEKVQRLLLVGDGNEYIAGKIGSGKAMAISEKLPPDQVISLCAGSVMFLSCNTVNNFMIDLKARLEAIS